MGWLGDFFKGTPDKAKQFSTLSPGSQNLQSQLTSGLSPALAQALQSIMGYLQPNEQSYEAFEKPLMRQFQEQIIPGLAEGFGGLGATSSSGAQQTFARAGTDLMERLGAQRAGLQENALDRVLSALQIALSPTQETTVLGGRPGFFDAIGSGIGKGVGILPYAPWKGGK